MIFFCIGVDHESADLETRGKVSLKSLGTSSQDWLKACAGKVLERVWVSTCNRVEFYGVLADSCSIEEIEKLRQSWAQVAQVDASAFQIYQGSQALRHLFRVTASLESMVVGESQILGQIKKSFEEARSNSEVGSYLHSVFQSAFRVAKKIRSQTEIARYPMSIPSLGVRLSERVLGSLGQARVGILGLGEIGRLSAEYFASVQPLELVLFNRTEAVAEDLVGKLKGQSVQARQGSPEEILRLCDVIVSAVDAQLVEKSWIEKREEEGRPFLLLDLAVPASLPDVSLSTGFLYRIDHLKEIAEENNQQRRSEFDKAQALIQEEVESLEKYFSERSSLNVLRELSVKSTSITEAELGELKKRLPHVGETDWQEIEKMAHRLSSKILQDPVVEIRSRLKKNSEVEGVLDFVRALFRV
jgi:glutamyl-tRNA reductase